MTLRMKQGETINWPVEDDLGDISGVTISAGLKGPDFYKALTIVPDDLTIGKYTITGPDTSAFPLGVLECDIKYVVSDEISFSNTFRVNIEESMTT